MQLYVLLTIFIAFFSGISIVLQKKGIERISGLKLRIVENYKINWKDLKILVKKLLNKHFVSGLIIGSVGTLIYLKAISIGEISVILPLLSLSIIVTWVLGILYLKEKLYAKEWLGVLLILAGGIMLSGIA